MDHVLPQSAYSVSKTAPKSEDEWSATDLGEQVEKVQMSDPVLLFGLVWLDEVVVTMTTFHASFATGRK